MTRSSFYDEYILRDQKLLELDRVRRLVELYDPSSRDVLDIGCGSGELLGLFHEKSRGLNTAIGLDVGEAVVGMLSQRGFVGIIADASLSIPLSDGTFDTVACAEVIEHVFDVDRLISEAYRVLRPGGSLLLSTPNLAYAPNRILLALGVQPLFTETSTVRNLGRWLNVLGQGGPTQGHLKVFTAGSLVQLLGLHGFSISRLRGYRFFSTGTLGLVDRLLASKATMAAGFVVRATKPVNAPGGCA